MCVNNFNVKYLKKIMNVVDTYLMVFHSFSKLVILFRMLFEERMSEFVCFFILFYVIVNNLYAENL